MTKYEWSHSRTRTLSDEAVIDILTSCLLPSHDQTFATKYNITKKYVSLIRQGRGAKYIDEIRRRLDGISELDNG